MRKFLILSLVVLNLWAYRWIFFEGFNLPYYKELYGHSQWLFPMSPRVISDSDLYKYVGYQLFLGANPLSLDAEVPPLGKYIYGMSAGLLGNPYFASVALFLATTLAFWYLAKLYLGSRKGETATILLLLIPFFGWQLGQTMLDLPQLLCLLLHLIFLRKTNFTFSVLAGLALGAFIGTKIGFIAPVIVLADVVYLFKVRRLRYLAIVLVSAAIFYIGLYWRYFQLGFSLKDWFSSQKWMANFYLQSGPLASLPFMEIISLLSGYFRGWWGSGWERVVGWTVLLPVVTGLYAFALIKSFRHRKKIDSFSQLLLIISFGLTFLYCFIAFWPRYLLLSVPLYLLVVLREFNLSGKLILVFAVIWLMTLFPLSFDAAKEDTRLWNAGLFKDLYVRQAGLREISSNDFARQFFSFETAAEISERKISIIMPLSWPWQDKVTGVLRTQYLTSLGDVLEEKPVTYIRINNKWTMVWNWDYLLSGYKPGDKLVLTKEAVKSGKLIEASGIILAKTAERPFISVNKTIFPDDRSLLLDLERLTKIHRDILRIMIYVMAPDGVTIPLAPVLNDFDPNVLARLRGSPALTLENKTLRLIQTELSQAGFREKILALDRQYPQASGRPKGSILLTRNGTVIRTIIESSSLPGKDIKLDRDLTSLGMHSAEMEKSIGGDWRQ